MASRPYLLISNDDGVTAGGINFLIEALRPVADLLVVAPDSPRSGQGCAITPTHPLIVRDVRCEPGLRVYACNGTPVDCVRLALGNLFPKPDIVLSGINHGGNLGTDTLYSGTVAAAHEAALLGHQAIAVSCMGHRPAHLDTAAFVARRAAEYLLAHPLPFGVVLNINVPDLPLSALKGVRTAPLSVVQYALRFEEREDPYGGR